MLDKEFCELVEMNVHRIQYPKHTTFYTMPENVSNILCGYNMRNSSYIFTFV